MVALAAAPGCGESHAAQADAAPAEAAPAEAAPADTGPAASLTPNPGFEILEESWRLPSTGATTVDLVTDEVHGGALAVRVDHAGEAAWTAETADAVPAIPLEALHFSAWLKMDGLTGQVRFALDEVDQSGASLARHETPPVTGTLPWTQQTLDVTTSSATHAIRPSIAAAGLGGETFSGTVHYDDLSLTPAVARQLVENPSFDVDTTPWAWHADVPTYVFRDTSMYRSPPASIRLDPKAPDPSDNTKARETWNVNHPVAAGQVLVASAWSRTDPGSYATEFSGSLLNIDFRPENSGLIVSTANSMLLPWGTSDWTRIETMGVAAPGEAQVIIAVGAFPSAHAGAAWFDDVALTLTDLMPNPGFEYFRPVGWNFQEVANAQWTTTLDPMVTHGGRFSLRVEYQGVPSIYDFVLDSAPHSTFSGGVPGNAIWVTPGSTVVLQGWARCDSLSTPTGFELAEYDDAGQDLAPPRRGPHNPTPTIQGTQDWTPLSRTITLTPATRFALVRIRTAIADTVGGAGPPPISGTAWYDDIDLLPQ